MPFAIFALFALAAYSVSPDRFQWWMILAGNALYYTMSGREQISVMLGAVALCIYRLRRRRSEKTAFSAHFREL